MKTFGDNWDGVKRDGLQEAQQVIGKYRFTPFTEGSIKGWTISIQGIGEVGYIQEPAKKNTKTTFSPYKVYRTLKATSPHELVMSALPGTENRIVSGKEIRFAPRQLLKAVAMWMDRHGKVMTESMEEVSEKLVGKQRNIDMNKDGKLTKTDFDILKDIRSKAEKKSKKAEGTEHGEEGAISEAMAHFTELDKAAKDIVDIVKGMPRKAVGYSPVQANLLKVANSLYQEHARMKDFFDGLIMSLEGINRKVGSPSKHGNMEIMRDIDMVIRELRKYRK